MYVGAASLLIVGIPAVLFSRRLRTFVFVFERGLVRVGGSESDVCRWDDIQEIRYASESVARVRHRSSTFTLAGGRQFLLPAVRRFDELDATVQRMVHDCLFRTALLDYQSGRPLLFGPALQVDRAGLTVGGRHLPWPQVGLLLPPDAEGKLVVLHRNGWDRLPAGNVAEVPNYFVLCALVRHAVGGGIASPAP